jgi:methylated-DNA-protein-cysteine methyltransferase related protein
VRFKAAVLALVARIPRGRVATYGQLAALAGKPRSARAVGQVMSRADGVPWHRVVNAQGGISRRPRMTGMLTQRIRLEQEGVVFRRGRVVMSRFRWHGGATGRRIAAPQAVAGPQCEPQSRPGAGAPRPEASDTRWPRRPRRASSLRGFMCD